MTNYSIYDLRKISESYNMVLEAQSRANGYKFLTPEQAEELAKLSPSYRSPQIWGNTSNWICSVANKILKYGNPVKTFEEVYSLASSAKNDIDAFEKYGKVLKKDIQTIPDFRSLSKFMEDARNSGSMSAGLSKEAKNDGRARQCYSLMKNGTDENDFVITFEDDGWLIGYPTNLEYNKRFASIGKWCHTGSFGDAEQYWGNYAQYPVFYILNKATGVVMCASYQNGYGEVRDQNDNYPTGFNGKNWNEFFDELGLKVPMVDRIGRICDMYDVPDDAHTSVYERVDEYEIADQLFGGMLATLEEDDYGRGTGNFYLSVGFESIDPDMPKGEDNNFYTRYAKDVDTSKYYTFEEFKRLSAAQGHFTGDSVDEGLLKDIVATDEFQRLWNTATTMVFYSWTGEKEMYDDRTMADRFSTDDLIEIVTGRDTDFGYDMARKAEDIRRSVKILTDSYRKLILEAKRNMIPSDHGDVDFYGDHVVVSIDADEAQHLSDQVRGGTTGIAFEGEPDILSINLKGKSSFALEKVDMSDLDVDINNTIATIKYYCRGKKDIEGQQVFDLKYNDGSKLYYNGRPDYS